MYKKFGKYFSNKSAIDIFISKNHTVITFIIKINKIKKKNFFKYLPFENVGLFLSFSFSSNLVNYSEIKKMFIFFSSKNNK